MTQEATHIPHSALAVNDESYWDVWHNPTDREFIVSVHLDHKQPRAGNSEKDDKWLSVARPHDKTAKEFFRLLPHTDTPIPRHYRGAVQTYLCDEPSCRAKAGSKMCTNTDHHPAIVIGGQCPLAIRKGAPHIRPNAVFHPDFEEVVDTSVTGRQHAKSDNRAKLQPGLEAQWRKITAEEPNVTFGPTGPQTKPTKVAK